MSEHAQPLRSPRLGGRVSEGGYGVRQGGVTSSSSNDCPGWFGELRAALPHIAHLDVTLEALETTLLPGWTGSTLHGGLGWALREVACSPICEERHSSEPGRCPLTRLFGAAQPARAASGWASAAAVPSLALRPETPAPPRVLAPRARWSFRLTLLGAASINDARAILVAVDRMGERGLGRGRGRLRLVSARSADVELWGGDRMVAEPVSLAPAAWARSVPAGALHVRALTPLHLTRRGRLIDSPRVGDLIAPALRRLMMLAAAHGAGEPATHAAATARALAGTVGPEEHAIWERFEASRWSERQRKRHEVVGVLGGLWAREVPSAVASVLTWASEVGMGKGSAMGLGHLAVELEPSPVEHVAVAAPRVAAMDEERPAPVRLDPSRFSSEVDNAVQENYA